MGTFKKLRRKILPLTHDQIKLMKAPLVIIIILFVQLSSLAVRGQEYNLDSLKHRCFQADSKSCRLLYDILRPKCKEIPTVSVDFGKCIFLSGCWLELATTAKDLPTMKRLFGEHSDSYKRQLYNFESIIQSTDSCRKNPNDPIQQK